MFPVLPCQVVCSHKSAPLLCFAALNLLLLAPVPLPPSQYNGLPQAASAVNAESSTQGPNLIEIFRLRFSNEEGGEISVSKDGGLTWQKLGTVLHPCEKVEPRGFTAAKWVEPVKVSASAVNAIHITTDYDPQIDRAAVFSILPREVFVPGSFLVPQASIITDLSAGEKIFGGGLAPLVGNCLWVEREGQVFLAQKGYVPGRGDRLTIVVERFPQQPTQLVFQNREGGLIWLQFPDGSRSVIGRVLRPVRGVGRFVGTRYAAVGRIRANHPGVIDISCSPLGAIGGFQIIPEGHSRSPEMKAALTMTQWMIVAPLSPEEHWEGTAPLFSQFLRPDYRPDDLYAPDWQDRLLSRFLVEVRRDSGIWGPCPAFSLEPDLSLPLPDWANFALADVSEIRLLFPVSPSRQ